MSSLHLLVQATSQILTNQMAYALIKCLTLLFSYQTTSRWCRSAKTSIDQIKSAPIHCLKPKCSHVPIVTISCRCLAVAKHQLML